MVFWGNLEVYQGLNQGEDLSWSTSFLRRQLIWSLLIFPWETQGVLAVLQGIQNSLEQPRGQDNTPCKLAMIPKPCPRLFSKEVNVAKVPWLLRSTSLPFYTYFYSFKTLTQSSRRSSTFLPKHKWLRFCQAYSPTPKLAVLHLHNLAVNLNLVSSGELMELNKKKKCPNSVSPREII